MIVFRRTFVSAALTVGLFGLSSRLSLAQDDGLFAIKGDDGQAIANFRLPAELAGDDVPGTVWAGSSAPEAILTEYFDYNCPYCRAAAPHFSALLKSDPVLKLGLVNNPVFGRASVQVASVQQAVLKTHGPDKTYAFPRAHARHARTCHRRKRVTGRRRPGSRHCRDLGRRGGAGDRRCR